MELQPPRGSRIFAGTIDRPPERTSDLNLLRNKKDTTTPGRIRLPRRPDVRWTVTPSPGEDADRHHQSSESQPVLAPEPPFPFRHLQRRPGLGATGGSVHKRSQSPASSSLVSRHRRTRCQPCRLCSGMLFSSTPSGAAPLDLVVPCPSRGGPSPDCLVQGHPVAALPQPLTE